jgi:benzoyl-CoA reductase/2-hydroxyglutaryl-CoA dehydratase subunit BcrC/BadD/HgdB
MQAVYNRAATEPFKETQEFLEDLSLEPERALSDDGKVPVFLFGNVLPDPEVFSLFDSFGIRVVAEDLCTGSRLFHPLEINGSGDLLLQIARSLLSRPACARTVEPARPGRMAEEILRQAAACKARGVIGHTVKFCDPYLARLPEVREVLRKAGLPLLVLEGDCTMRSLGQYRTRIEAFVEMLW